MSFRDLVELASERSGGAVLWANDESLAPKERLLKTAAPVGRPGGRKDGWETRRRRTPGSDECIVRLGLPGVVRGIVVDTSHFPFDHPESCSLEACAVDGQPDIERLRQATWTEILPRSPLKGDAENEFPIGERRRITHLRFKIHPDGAVARMRVYGEAMPDWRGTVRLDGEIDLAAMENGGLVTECSDVFRGSRQNLILPGPALDAADGWETRRRRGPGFDWAIVKLAAPGNIQHVEVDTMHFSGSSPESCSIESCDPEGLPLREILPRTLLQPNTRHHFEHELSGGGPVSHIRFNIFPDGGVSRLRIRGAVSAPRLSEKSLLSCCGSRRWAARMDSLQPFAGAGDLLRTADSIALELGHEDWLEAFAAHPLIGQTTQDRRAHEEQSGALGIAASVADRLRAVNRAYEERFGYIYIVCATGKTAEQMLSIAESRLGNDPDAELTVAAEEQMRITRLRLLRAILGQ